MEQLNNKVISSSDETLFSAQVSGLYGFDSSAEKWRRLTCDADGKLNIEATLELDTSTLAKEAKQDTIINATLRDINNTTGIGDGSSQATALSLGYDRSNGQGRAILVDSGGKVEVNASMNAGHGLATEAKQDAIIADLTDGTQLARCMGSEDPNDPAGTQKQLHLDGSGNVQTNIVNTVNIAPANSVNSGITNDPANSVAVGLRGRTTIGDSTTETFLLCDSNGHLQVDVLSGGGGGTQYNQGDALGATPTGTLCIGKDNLGNAIPIHVTSSGDLEVEIADYVRGQTNMANSFPVNIASDQSRIDVDTVKDEVVISQVNQAITNGNTFTSTGVDMRGYERISFFGNSTNTADEIYVLVSADDITYYTTGAFVTKDFTTGDFSYDGTLGARYFKLRQASTDFNSNFTITCISSKK